MKYLLLGDEYKKLFIEDEKQFRSFKYDSKEYAKDTYSNLKEVNANNNFSLN